MLNLENLGVSEMSIQEQKETEGGFWAIFALCVILVGIAACIYDIATRD